jgi:hypothetical protein
LVTQTFGHAHAVSPARAQWDETALRIKAARLMGSQSLARYPGWKGNRAAVEAEQRRNKALGDATGCWKSGVLVEVRHLRPITLRCACWRAVCGRGCACADARFAV